MALKNETLDSHAGYHSFASELGDYGSFQVFWFDGERFSDDDCWVDCDGEPYPAGWYWWACFPGCIPDGSPLGPFETSQEAFNDAKEEES